MIAIALSVICLVLVVALCAQARDHACQLDGAEGRWREERAELLNRIQRPDILPYRERGEPREPREPRDVGALAEVGRVVPIRPDSDSDGEGG